MSSPPARGVFPCGTPSRGWQGVIPRVIAALNKAADGGAEISVSAVARAAAVDRSFLYRHRDLLSKIHASQASPLAAGEGTAPAVTRASLQADLLAAHERTLRLTARIRQLEHRLSKVLGEQALRESGSAPPPTSMLSTRKSPTSSSRPLTCGSSSNNATKTSPPPGQPTRELMAQLNHTTRRG